MAESILVTGKKISSMELVTNVTGNEKIPTGQPDDLAITPNQIADHTIARGDLANHEDLSQVEVSLGTQITDLANDLASDLAAEEAARIAADNLKVDKEGSVSSVAGRVGDVVLAPSDVLVEGFGSQEGVNKYVPKPFLSGYTYGLGERVVLNDGEVVKSLVDGNEGNPNVNMTGWVSTVSDSLSDTIQTFNTPEAGVDTVTGVADGSYFNVRSTSDESYIDEYQNVGGSAVPTGKRCLSAYGVEQQEKPASTIKDASGLSQQEINDARVLAVDSIADLLALPEGKRKEGLRYEVTSYHADWDVESPDSGPVGGGAFIWVADSEVDADSVLVFSSGGAVGRFIRVVEGDRFFAVWAGLRPDDDGDQAVTMQAAYDVFVKGFAEGRYNSFTLPDFEVKLSQLKLSNPMDYTGEMKQQRFLGGHITHIGADFLFTKADASNVQMVRWEGTHFTGTTDHGPLVDADSMRRLYFSGCGFRSVNTAVYSSAYAQSIYFIDGCSVFRGSGWFIDTHNLFDVVFTDSQMEARQHGIRTRSVTGDPAANSLRVTNNVLQGFLGKVISLGACYGSTISENYFEANQGGDIDCSNGTAFHKGLSIKGNGFQPTASQKADPDYASIRWGKGASGFASGGNYSTGKLHKLDSSNETWLDYSNDGALGQTLIGTSPLSEAGRSPVGRTEYWHNTGKVIAWSSRFMNLDPYNAGIMFGGAGRSEDLGNGTQANTWLRFGSTPTPGNYPGAVFKQGSRILNTSPVLMGDAGSRYVITEWVCLKSGVIGSGAVFQELRAFTGT